MSQIKLNIGKPTINDFPHFKLIKQDEHKTLESQKDPHGVNSNIVKIPFTST